MSSKCACSFCGKTRKEVEVLLEGPAHLGETIYICNECVVSGYSVLNESPAESSVTDLTPEKIKDILDRFVIDQDHAKKVISVAVYNHMLRSSKNLKNVDKSNIMLIGPSGSGKTLIVKTIANALNVPYVIVSATSLTETGYVGNNVEDIIAKLYRRSGGDIEKTQRGIIFIDEVDKKVKKDSNTRDISGEGVQQALLTVVEGTEVTINVGNRQIEVDTSNILFISSGAFVDLDKTIDRRLGQKTIGFSSRVGRVSDLTTDLEPVDLISYGLIPEFVGRFPVVAMLTDLNEDTLYRILLEPDNSLTKQYTKLFNAQGIDIEFSDGYLRSVAKRCTNHRTGARGLRKIFEDLLLETQYQISDIKLRGVKKIRISDEGEVVMPRVRASKKVKVNKELD